MKQSPVKMMQSSELARLAGISVDTLRYYERNQLMPAAQRSSSGYRLFQPEALLRLQMIRGALSVGFSIKELRQIFTVRDKGGAPCHQVRELGSEKLRLVEHQIRDLQSRQRALRKILVNWDRLLEKTPHGRRAGLLEVFVHPKEKST